jgi:ligand-binding sensor domain-containing protein
MDEESVTYVGSTLEDSSGDLWFASSKGLLRFDGNAFVNITEQAGLGDGGAGGMCEDRHGNIWFAVKGSGVYRYDGASFTNFSEKEGLTSHAVHRVVEDSRGRIWCIGWMGAFRYDGESFVNVTRDGPW